MGRGAQQLEILLVKKDEQINILETRIQAYTTRVSQLQTRLLSTLDTLDRVRNLKEQELDSMECENARLKDQLHRHLVVLKAVQAERDDLRDAVLQLIEKVEASNDYSKWPRSQIQLSSFSGSLSHPLSTHLHISEDHILSYASSILSSLRLERDNERKAHVRTRDLAEKRILDLEAKLSWREVELERCITDGPACDVCLGSGDGDRTPRRRASSLATASPLPPPADPLEKIGSEEIISMLDATVARNKVLESEVKTLFRRLEERRASTSQTSDAPNSRVQQTEPNHRLNWRSQSPPLMRNDHRGYEVEEIDNSLLQDHPHVERQLLRDLDHQIRELGRKVDTFAEERRNILQGFPSAEPLPHPGQNSAQRIRALEGECDSLRKSEFNLRNELENVRADARSREEDLMKRIRALDLKSNFRKNEQERPNVQAPPTTPIEPPDLLGPFGVDDGEISMELATPLMPTNAFDMNADIHLNFMKSTSPQVHSPRSPKPPSPDRIPSVAAVDEPLPTLYPLPQSEPYIPADDSYYYYVDPPSIPLPPSPPGIQDHDSGHPEEEDYSLGDSPTLSQIMLETTILAGEMHALNRHRPASPEAFATELHRVEMQLSATEHAVEDGQVALERLEELVRELHPP